MFAGLMQCFVGILLNFVGCVRRENGREGVRDMRDVRDSRDARGEGMRDVGRERERDGRAMHDTRSSTLRITGLPRDMQVYF